KRTLVVSVRRTLDFQTCRPSAHYQLPLVSSCPGACSYCYLLTTLGNRPFVRVYVNIDEILQRAAEYTHKRLPEDTVFEGAATSDPVPVERYTGSLTKAIEFFSAWDHARFRFVTKFTDVSAFLDARHAGKTEVRFSVNAEAVAREYEVGVPTVPARIVAAGRVAAHGFPTGFMIAPIIVGPGWKEQYEELFRALSRAADEEPALGRATLEFVTHRYTGSARHRICEVFPERVPPMDDESRRFKFGQFGYGKYLYPPETMEEIKGFFEAMVASYLPGARWLYLV
ncbi:MAG: spore photoproduct lyase, partial [Bacillota bacterium]|nr:spore photoproduct lyase [Bacillota bacterium]